MNPGDPSQLPTPTGTAADLAQCEARLRDCEVQGNAQLDAFQAAIDGASLITCLDILIRPLAPQHAGDSRAAFYLIDPDGTRLHPVSSAGGMSDDYLRKINSFKIDPDSIACGLCAATGRAVVTRDVQEEPAWVPWLHLAKKFAFRSCWSFPIRTQAGKLLGTLAVYHHEPRDAPPHELSLAQATTRAASIIISRHAEAEERERISAALRASEERFRLFITAASEIAYRMSADWTQMLLLEGEKILEDTSTPSQTWLNKYIPETDKVLVQAAIAEAIRTRTSFELEHRFIRADGTVGWTFSRAIPLLDDAGEIVEWFGAASDMTGRKHAEETLRASEEKYRTLFESIDEGFCLLEPIYDAAGVTVDLRFRETNRAFARQSGAEGCEGRTMREMLPGVQPYWMGVFDQVARTGEPARFENHVTVTDRWFSVYASRHGGLENPLVAVVFNDITERKRREANLAFLAEISQDLARLTDIDKAMDLLGSRMGAYFGVQQCLFVEHAEEFKMAIVTYGWHAEGARDLRGKYQTRDFLSEELKESLAAGKPITVRDTQSDPRVNAVSYGALDIHAYILIPLVHEGEWRFQMAIIDDKPRDWREDEVDLMHELATRIWTRLERARAEEALAASSEEYRTLFTSIDEGFCTVEVIFDDSGKAVDCRFLKINAAFERQTGIINGKGRFMREIEPDLEEFWFEAYGKVARTGEAIRFQHKAESLGRHFDVYAFRIGPTEERRVAIVYTDITERTRVETALHASLAEQKALLQELHHRVKNNLQVITSLLEMQARKVDDEQALLSLMEAANRVGSIAGIHELLYQGGTFSRVEFRSYAVRLLEHLLAFYQVSERIQTRVVGEDLPIGLDRAVPCGLILNELVSNVCKHAFPRGARGELIITLHQEADGRLSIAVQDNGIGLPEAFTDRHLVSLGIHLVKVLAKQLGGTVSFHSPPGTRVAVNLPRGPSADTVF